MSGEDREIVGWIAKFLGVILGLIALVLVVGSIPVYYVQRANCHSFGAQTVREVKWVRYTIVKWDCLTTTADGKWIPTKNLREFGEQP